MIMVGKVLIALVWSFWMMAMSTVEGQMTLEERLSLTLSLVMDKENIPKPEYNLSLIHI